MLSMLLLLTQAAAPAPAAEPQALMRTLGGSATYCRREPLHTVEPVSPGNGLMWRGEGQPVGLYRLLDRRVNGCPDPIIVNYRVPGSRAVGRELQRAPSGR